MSKLVVWGTAALVVVIVGGSAIVAARMGGAVSPAEAVANAEPIKFEMSSGRGLWLGVYPTFPQDRQLTGGTARIGEDVQEELTFWSETYEVQDSMPDPFPVEAGTRVLVAARVVPNCEDIEQVPLITLESRLANGNERTDYYRPSNLDEYRAALDAYCPLKPEIELASSSQEVDHDFSVTFYVWNPTADEVRVESDAFRDGKTIWEQAAVTVPPRDSGELVLRGHGQGCSHVNPWTTGHVRVNGEVLELSDYASQQC